MKRNKARPVFKRLWSQKASIYLLYEMKMRSQRQLAELLQVSRWSVQQFLTSPAYISFRALMRSEHEPMLDELQILLPDFDVDTVQGLNEMSLSEVVEGLRERFPELDD